MARFFSHKRYVAVALLSVWVAVGTWHTFKPLPPGTNLHTPSVQADTDGVRFLADLTYLDATGTRRSEQEVFDAVFELIDEAHTFIVADFFLFNDAMGATSSSHRALSAELTARLLARKAANPALQVLLVTDPVNEIYGGTRSAALNELKQAGIDVVTTDLRRLRDSNPAYSAVWRMIVQWWGNEPDAGFMPNPFGDRPTHITLRSWLSLLNFKANHRKLIVADRADGSTSALVSSANPHDASSAHSNVALQVTGPLAVQIAAHELDIATFSGWQGALRLPPVPASKPVAAAAAEIDFVTEGAIREHLLATINATHVGDSVQIAMFYLSERSIIDALLRASERGARVQLILDPNKDAFGREKDGVPNRPVAFELVNDSARRIEVRWYQTTGEQFHTKLALIKRGDRLIASLGSANLTRRNVGNYNLEGNVALGLAADSLLATRMLQYFDRLWRNHGGQYTLPFDAYADADRVRHWRYRFMEATGLSTF